MPKSKIILFVLLFSFIRVFSQNNIESLPEFPGGKKELDAFINQCSKRVQFEYNHGIEGKVEVSFVIDTNGTVTDVELSKGLKYGPGYNQEAIRIIKLLPKWKPASINGKPVKIRMTLPISFTTPYAENPYSSVTEANLGHPEKLIAELAEVYEPEPVWLKDSLLQVSKILTVQKYIVPENQWWAFLIINNTIFDQNVACGCLKTLTIENTNLSYYNNLSIFITYPNKPEVHFYFTPDGIVKSNYLTHYLPFKVSPGTIFSIEGSGCQVPIAIFEKKP